MDVAEGRAEAVSDRLFEYVPTDRLARPSILHAVAPTYELILLLALARIVNPQAEVAPAQPQDRDARRKVDNVVFEVLGGALPDHESSRRPISAALSATPHVLKHMTAPVNINVLIRRRAISTPAASIGSCYGCSRKPC